MGKIDLNMEARQTLVPSPPILCLIQDFVNMRVLRALLTYKLLKTSKLYKPTSHKQKSLPHL